MANFRDRPEVQRLFAKFQQDYYQMVRDAVLEELSESITGTERPKPKVGMSHRQRGDDQAPLGLRPWTRPAPKKSGRKVIPNGFKTVKPPRVGKTVGVYMPAVSEDVQERVAAALRSNFYLGLSASSTQISKDAGIGETSVRCALKHLVAKGWAKAIRVGRSVQYKGTDDLPKR